MTELEDLAKKYKKGEFITKAQQHLKRINDFLNKAVELQKRRLASRVLRRGEVLRGPVGDHELGVVHVLRESNESEANAALLRTLEVDIDHPPPLSIQDSRQ